LKLKPSVVGAHADRTIEGEAVGSDAAVPHQGLIGEHADTLPVDERA
jgi:hypothetical protein